MDNGWLENAAPGSLIANAKWADPDYIADKYFYRPGAFWIGRNPHNGDQAIGHSDQRHVLICSGAGGGKGRSLIINNLALWPGSIAVYDPKGELPDIITPRRSKEGDQYCEGMGQEVYVLDPLRVSDVDDRYRAYFDPLSALDPEDGELPTWARRIARGLIDIPEQGEAANWARRAAQLIELVIMYVITARYAPEDRTLMKVLQLILEGDMETFQMLLDERPEGAPDLDPMVVLLRMMTHNPACRGHLAAEARSMLRRAEHAPRFFESVRSEAADQLGWLKSEGIEASLTGSVAGRRVFDRSRQFDPGRLKTDPAGVSVFVVMPVDDMDTYTPWVQTVFMAIFAAMRRTPAPADLAHPTLMMLDEFSSLGYQDYIASSLDNIRSAGIKIAFVLQNFGTLKKLYGDKMESFFTNSGLELYFGKIGDTAASYVMRQLGDTEIVRIARSANTSKTVGESESETLTFGTVLGEGGSQTSTTTDSSAFSRGRAFNWSDTRQWSDSSNWGQSDGTTMGENYGPHVFFRGLERSTSFGTNLSRNRGGSHTSGGSKTRGNSRNEQTTRTRSRAHAVGSSWTTSQSESHAKGRTTSHSTTIGGGVAETFHKKPLLELHEINEFLRSFANDEFDHPAYPGMALARIDGEPPFFVRRSNYDQDSYFERCFSKDRNFAFIPLSEQPILGYRYTDDHIVNLTLPKLILDDLASASDPFLRRFSVINANDTVASYYIKSDETTEYVVRSPVSGRILEASTPDQTGTFATIRSFTPVSESQYKDWRQLTYENPLTVIKQQVYLLEKQKAEEQRQTDEIRRKRQEHEQTIARKRKLFLFKTGAAAGACLAALIIYNSFQPSPPDSQGSFSGEFSEPFLDEDSSHFQIYNEETWFRDATFTPVRLWGMERVPGSQNPFLLGAKIEGEIECEWFWQEEDIIDTVYVAQCFASNGEDLAEDIMNKLHNAFRIKESESKGYYEIE